MPQKTNLVTSQWLHEHIEQPNIVVLYTQMDNPVTAKTDDCPVVYIPKSMFFDFENVFRDSHSSLPHTMPDETSFTKGVCELGINQDSVIIIYDNKGIYCAPRVWWMFKSMGHQHVYILNGGLPNWLAQNMPTVPAISMTPAASSPISSKSTSSEFTLPELTFLKKAGNFTARFDNDYFLSADEIIQQLSELTLLDARSAGRFNGTQPEPRKGLRAGHVPTAVSLPFQQCLNGTQLKSSAQLQEIFSEAALTPGNFLVFSCGSGVTACILALAATEAGYKKLAVYDGSWSEWGARNDLPVEL